MTFRFGQEVGIMEATGGSLLWGVAYMAGLGLALSLVLAAAQRWLYVYEDPRIGQLEALLPGTNCGACGRPGCRAFALALDRREVQPADCNVGNVEERTRLAEFLGVEVGQKEVLVARLACNGGVGVARQAFEYPGPKSCRAAVQVAGGPLECTWGCLGYGDCQEVCTFDAIRLNERGIPQVDFAKCTACGDCVDICPKDLFSLAPKRQGLWVYCNNRQEGDVAFTACRAACTGCGLCVQDAPAGLIQLEHHLAVIDADQWSSGSAKAAGRCPTGAIKWRPDV